MDLNDLYRRHQIALYMAEHASCESECQAHLGLAEVYAGMITRGRGKPRRVAAQ
jgi:hypothetical protein